MTVVKITFETTHEGADFLADACFSVGASGVEISDIEDVKELYGSGIVWDYIEPSVLEGSDTVLLSCCIDETDFERKVQEIKDEISFYTDIDFGTLRVTKTVLADTDWSKEWRKNFVPINIGKFRIIPIWLKKTDENTEDLIKLYIDPCGAFGTGDHETTKLCLDGISKLSLKNKSVIDVGTGSGILAVASCLIGAKSVYACDIDSLAIKNAEVTAAENGVSDKITIEERDLLSDKSIKGDVILANLTADILVRLCAGLKEHINEDGIIIVSGIIHSRKDEVITAYTSNGFTLKSAHVMGEWNSLVFGI
ncbi:MAG: 50S ribosomal protein L11 methyltransferase [Christensenellaceae bacterium]|jgi:ribosomal protein L11 methyltransferase|nr:50S ribosomal protein L11 methyltransferase [Christensenellaceae bacterium]